MNSVAAVLASWFGCGYAPLAPGTAGSLAAAVLAYVAGRYWGAAPWVFLFLGAALLLPGVWAASRMQRITGRADPAVVVLDEVVGQWIGLAGASSLDGRQVFAAFLLFRLLDITKPFPVGKLEGVPGGWGVMLDDVMAGAYAALVMVLLGWFHVF